MKIEFTTSEGLPAFAELGESLEVGVHLADSLSKELIPNGGSIKLPAGFTLTREVTHSVERLIETLLLSPLSVRGRLSVTLRVAG